MTPVYSDKTRFSMMDLLPPILSVWLLITGLTGGGALPIVMGLGVVAYLLFTRHKSYELFEDALVVRFFAPKTLVVYLSNVQEVRLMRQPLVGPVLLIERNVGGKLIIKPSDYEEFLSRLTAALGK